MRSSCAGASGPVPDVSPLVCVLGPTASGKTGLALSLAQTLDGEIVSVDSALVYRGLDIGSAKPTLEERARVAHHLIDLVEPDDPYSAARFVADAASAIHGIRSRGRRPILVGGTMLYFKALLAGLADMPAGDARVRERLAAEGARCGWQALHARLAIVDPRAASRIHGNDAQRIVRALEVVELSGCTISELHGATRPVIDEPVVALALLPADRAWLHARIARRLETMRHAGFDREVQALHRRGLSPELPALRSVGYRQALEALRSDRFHHETGGGPPRWPERAIAATRQLAKRQLTWLRGLPTPVAIPCDTLDPPGLHRRALDVVQAGAAPHTRLFDTTRSPVALR